jgi:tRNA1Val (adenine37-N6)-methyltransferase
MRFVQPSVEKKATMVLIELVKCAKPGVCIESPLIIYKDIGIYSDEVQEVYKK